MTSRRRWLAPAAVVVLVAGGVVAVVASSEDPASNAGRSASDRSAPKRPRYLSGTVTIAVPADAVTAALPSRPAQERDSYQQGQVITMCIGLSDSMAKLMEEPEITVSGPGGVHPTTGALTPPEMTRTGPGDGGTCLYRFRAPVPDELESTVLIDIADQNQIEYQASDLDERGWVVAIALDPAP